jgi:ribosomal protein S13
VYDSPPRSNELELTNGIDRSRSTVVVLTTMPFEFADPALFRDALRGISAACSTKPLYLALAAQGSIPTRVAHIVVRRAGLDPLARASALSPREEDRLVRLIRSPRANGIPSWALNRRFNRDRARGQARMRRIASRTAHGRARAVDDRRGRSLDISCEDLHLAEAARCRSADPPGYRRRTSDSPVLKRTQPTALTAAPRSDQAIAPIQIAAPVSAFA